MSGQPDLAYDVGLHDGADTAYYLSLGLRVVAIEANPLMVEAARQKFAGEISEGRLTVVGVGVGARVGVADFWVCNDHSDWSSFDRAVASRGGANHHAVEVEVSPFHVLLDRYGVPKYCKIDIEGNDHLCLDDLRVDRRPDFVSVEFGRGQALEKLAAIGYDRFKIVEQSHFTVLTSGYEATRSALPEGLSQFTDRVRNRVRGTRRDGDWRFPDGSSGPLPDRTSGRWMNVERARGVLGRLAHSYRTNRRGLGAWFDIHATDEGILRSPNRVSRYRRP